jgi:hypothetical protein
MDWKSLVGTVAPWIGTALGGPLGGMAVTALGSALGLSDKTEDTIKQALAGVTPEQMLAMKTADQQFQTQMQELGFKDIETLEKIAADDRKDARAMQTTTRSNVPATLSSLITLGFFAILWGLLQGWLKVNDSQALLLLLGSLSTAWVSVIAYWFGTTHSSSEKTQMIAAQAAKGAANG